MPMGMPAFMKTTDCFDLFGCPSAEALILRFERGNYPRDFLFKITPRRYGVNVEGLLDWIAKNQINLNAKAMASISPSIKTYSALDVKGDDAALREADIDCHNPKCRGRVNGGIYGRGARGLCVACYRVITRLVKTGRASWDQLERAGKVLPVGKLGARASDRTKWFLDGVNS